MRLCAGELCQYQIKLLILTVGQAVFDAFFGQGRGTIVLDDVQCSGSENQLLVCQSAPILTVSSNCGHDDDAGVICEGIVIIVIDYVLVKEIRLGW